MDIPRNSLTVITGLSGSGKSSLAFDTIYAEGQRRYLESLSSYARQFLGEFKRPDIREIEGLSPVIAIDQKSVSHNPRSTVGTVTEIHDYLRLLYARIGTPHCTICGRTLEKQSVDEIIERIEKEYEEGERIAVLAPIVFEKKGEYKNLFDYLRRRGFLRVIVDGEEFLLEDEIVLKKQKRHTVKLVVDRLKMKVENHQRLVESVEIALNEGNGQVEIMNYSTKETEFFSEKLACPICGVSFPEMSPKLFSFNSPYGACPACAGLGYTLEIGEEFVIDRDKSVLNGGIIPYRSGKSFVVSMIKRLIVKMGADPSLPFQELPKDVQNAVLFGGPGFKGLVRHLKDRYQETESEEVREWIERNFLVRKVCETCNGKRLRKEALAVTVGGKNIAEVSDMTVKEAYEFFEKLRLESS